MSAPGVVPVNETSRLLFVGPNTTTVLLGLNPLPRTSTHREVLGAVNLGFTSTVARIVESPAGFGP